MRVVDMVERYRSRFAPAIEDWRLDATEATIEGTPFGDGDTVEVPTEKTLALWTKARITNLQVPIFTPWYEVCMTVHNLDTGKKYEDHNTVEAAPGGTHIWMGTFKVNMSKISKPSERIRVRIWANQDADAAILSTMY